MPDKRPMPAREAFDALQTLIDELAKVDISGLKRQGKPKLKHVKSQNPDEWVAALRTAQDEIEEWCPGFSMELPPK